MIMLIRHAAHPHIGKVLSGRTPGLALGAEGRRQAEALARNMKDVIMHDIHASPVQRAQETAQAIAALHPGLSIATEPSLDELDFGEWTGRSFAELAGDPRWRTWNEARRTAAAPGGESMAAAQARAWSHIEHIAAAAPGRTVAMVTHCDIIRGVIARALDLSLDRIDRFDIDPASVSRLAVGAWGAKVLSLNETCA